MSFDPAGSTILIVEDESLIRMVGVDILENAGFQVLEAENADEALTILAGPGDICLLFSDIDMPGTMNGLDLAEVVHERWPAIKLLMTSGFHRVSEADLPDHGKFVRKPWTQDALVEKIRDVLTA